MSDELESLKKDLQQHKDGIDGLLAQLDAHKQMFNESLNSNLQLRAQNLLLQKQLNTLNEKLNAAQREVENLKPKEPDHATE